MTQAAHQVATRALWKRHRSADGAASGVSAIGLDRSRCFVEALMIDTPGALMIALGAL